MSLKLPAVFGDGMVLAKDARIWGTAEPGQRVAISFLGQTYEALADGDGRFAAEIHAQTSGGPHRLTIGDRTFRDVYVGAVWLCGGQSNMEMSLGEIRHRFRDEIGDEPRIRVYQPQKRYAFDGVVREAETAWFEAAGERLDEVYAVPYFFAQALLEGGETVIGLLNVAAGGTSAEAWLPEETVNRFPRHAERLRGWKEPGLVRRTEEEDARRVRRWHTELDRRDPGLLGRWYDPGADDSDWENAALTDTEGLSGYGSVWYRKTVDLPPGFAADSAVWELGRGADSVTLYLNGRRVHSVEYQYPRVRCVLPEGVLRPGRNLLAVRLTGERQPPRFIPDKPYALSSQGGGTADLTGPWKRKIGQEMPRLEPEFWFYDLPCAVYYTMLAPVLGYQADGVIWYQGESNTAQPDDYAELFAAFVALLRRGIRPDLPVIFTQLARFDDPDDPGGRRWAALREQQALGLNIPNTAMADAWDCGEWNDIHPLDKRTVGRRLAEQRGRLLGLLPVDGPEL
jgi:sialate O-acetylesterase